MSRAIVVAERLGLVRDGLVALLTAGEAAPGTVQGAASLAAAQELMTDQRGGVLLLDLGLIDGRAAGLLAINAAHPTWSVVALSDCGSREIELECLAAGAHGTVAKTAEAAELLRVVALVQRGGVHVPDILAGSDETPPSPPPHAVAAVQLTGRQKDVLRLVAEGRSTKDIARSLDLAVSTIKVHLAAVYRTVGAHNRVEALCRTGLLPQDRSVFG